MVSTHKAHRMKARAVLLLGPAKSGKTTAVLERFAADCAPGARGPVQPFRTILIVPGRHDLARVKRSLGRSGKAFFSPALTTMDGLSRRLLDSRLILTLPLDHAKRLWLLRKILCDLETAGKLKVLHHLKENNGFLNNLANFFAELKHAEIFYDRLKEGLSRKTPDPKDQDVLAIYAHYQEALVHHGYYDREGILWQAKAAIADNPLLDHTQTLLVDGFDTFTPTQLGFVKSLAGRIPRVLITLTLEPQAARTRLFSSVEETRARLHELFSLEEQWVSPPARSHSLCQRIFAETIFEEEPQALPAPLPVLHEAVDVLAESRWCAGQIKKIAAANPQGIADIAVCVRDLTLYEEPLARQLDAHSLPFVMDRRKSMAQTFLGRFLFSFLAAYRDKNLDDLLNCLASPLMENGLAAMGFPSADWMCRAFQEGAIKEFMGDWKTRLLWAIRNKIPFSPPLMKELPDKMEALRENFSSWPPAQTAAAHCDTLRRLFARWKVDEAVLKIIKEEETRGVMQTAVEWEKFWNLIQDCVFFRNHLSHPDDNISLQEFAGDLEPFFNETTVAQEGREGENPAPAVRGKNRNGLWGVRVCEAHHLRGASFHTLFILGLNENIFPAAGGFFSLYDAHQRQQMIEAGLALQDERQRDAKECFLFYQVVSAARESLYASWHRSNPSSKECLPSPFFHDLKRLCSSGPKEVQDRPPLSLSSAERWPSEDPARWTSRNEVIGAYSLHLFTPKRRRPPFWRWVESKWAAEKLGDFRRFRARAMLERQRESRLGFSVFDAQMRDPGLLKNISSGFGLACTTSASRLKKYAECPFRFYSCYLLRLDRMDDPAGELGAAIRGNLMHRILWMLYQGHFQQESTQPAAKAFEAMQEDLDRVAEKVFADHEKSTGILRVRIWEWEKSQILNKLRDFLQHEMVFFQEHSQRVPACFELAYGFGKDITESDPNSTPAPFVLTDGTVSLNIRGKIDRIDLETAADEEGLPHLGFWVIDYKTGKDKVGKSDMRSGREVQLPIYLFSAQSILEKIGIRAQPLGVCHYKFSPPRHENQFNRIEITRSGVLKKNSDWDSVLQSAKTHILGYAAHISNGRFTPTPPDNSCFYYCEYRGICRFDEHRIEAKNRAGRQSLSAQETSDESGND